MPFRLVHILLLLAAFAGTGEVWSQEEGLASYYHNRFHGRKAASGWVHDADELVAAHRTYPFGTFLRVTNLARVRIEVVPGKMDLSMLDLLYPQIPFLEVDHLRVRPPYRIDMNK